MHIAAPGPPTPAGPGLSRLQDVIRRVGEICLAPDLASAMLAPLQSLAALTLPLAAQQEDPHASPARDPAEVLDRMKDQTASPVDAYHASILLARLTSDYLPPPVLVQRQLSLVGWKVETPPRIVLYTGSGMAPSDTQGAALPHTLPKILLDERSRRPDPSAIHVVARTEATPEQHVRDSLLHHAQTELTPYYETVTTSKQQGTKALALSHTLEEAFACFVQTPTPNHTTVALNASPAWNKDHVDARYAETQQASNGMRHRDWLCLYASEKSVEKCKLDSHVLDIARYYECRFPWKRGADQPIEWVLARSSLPLDPRVLRDIGPSAASPEPDRFTAFTRAVKGRFLQDLKLLPVPDPHRDTLQRANTSVYTDEPSLQVLIVYAPDDGQGRLQFVSLGLMGQF